MNWFYLSLISIVALATAELAQQHVLHTKNKFDERTSGALTFLIQTIFTIPIILFSGLGSQMLQIFDLSILKYVLTTNLIASIAMIFYLRSFKVNNISFSSILVSISVVVSTLIGILWFGESVTFTKFTGIFLILVAIIGVNYKNIHIEPNHKWGLIAGIMFGMTYSLDKLIVNKIQPLVYIFWGFMFVSLFGFLQGPKKIIENIKKSEIRDYLPIFISGLGYFVYNMCTFYAYRLGGEVGRIDAINNSQIFLLILFEYIIFKHTRGVARKIIFAGVAFTGVYILGNF